MCKVTSEVTSERRRCAYKYNVLLLLHDAAESTREKATASFINFLWSEHVWTFGLNEVNIQNVFHYKNGIFSFMATGMKMKSKRWVQNLPRCTVFWSYFLFNWREISKGSSERNYWNSIQYVNALSPFLWGQRRKHKIISSLLCTTPDLIFLALHSKDLLKSKQKGTYQRFHLSSWVFSSKVSSSPATQRERKAILKRPTRTQTKGSFAVGRNLRIAHRHPCYKLASRYHKSPKMKWFQKMSTLVGWLKKTHLAYCLLQFVLIELNIFPIWLDSGIDPCGFP